MPFIVEFTDEFELWWNDLSEPEQDSVYRVVGLLEERGPALSRPYADTLKGSKYANMRELRVQHGGEPYRILYVFDVRRAALLLVGGNKTGDGRWYERMLPIAEKIYARHLLDLAKKKTEQGG